MKISRLLTSCLTLLTLHLLSGCNDLESRIQEKITTYNQLGPETQNRLRNQDIAVGDSADMVFIALGRPDSTEALAGAGGGAQVWIYRNVPASSPAVALADNQAGARYQASRESVHAPRNETSLSSTKSVGPSQGLNVADIPTHTLYVIVTQGTVTGLQLTPPAARTP